MRQDDLIDIFITPLEESQFEYIITGSVAAIFYGEPRLTHDIDIVIHLFIKDIQRFIGLFPDDSFYCPPEEFIRIEIERRSFAHFNLIHYQTGLKADLYPIYGNKLHLWALKNKKRINLTENKSLYLAPIEYVILKKLEYYREGKSNKHIDDIRNMISVSGDQIDYSFMNSVIDELDLKKYWDETIKSSR